MPALISQLLRILYRHLPPRIKLKISFLRGRIRKRFIGPFGEAVLVSSYNGDLLVDARDNSVGGTLAFSGEYERENIEHLLSLISAESRVLIVGTHVGAVLIPIARKAASVVGVEANPDTFRLLRLNLLINNIDNAQVYNFAAGDRNGRIEFFKNTHNSGGSKIKTGQIPEYEFVYDDPAVVEVPMKRLDDVVEDPHFDLIVMDIEGAEYFALQGMSGLLEKCPALQLEVLPISIEKVAGVRADEFILPLERHFDTACIQGGEGELMTFARENFGELMRLIYGEISRASGLGKCSGRDVIFLKSPGKR